MFKVRSSLYGQSLKNTCVNGDRFTASVNREVNVFLYRHCVVGVPVCCICCTCLFIILRAGMGINEMNLLLQKGGVYGKQPILVGTPCRCGLSSMLDCCEFGRRAELPVGGGRRKGTCGGMWGWGVNCAPGSLRLQIRDS